MSNALHAHKQGGQREVLLGVDDGFITENKYRSIPRADVAELAVQAVSLDEAKEPVWDCPALTRTCHQPLDQPCMQTNVPE